MLSSLWGGGYHCLPPCTWLVSIAFLNSLENALDLERVRCNKYEDVAELILSLLLINSNLPIMTIIYFSF